MKAILCNAYGPPEQLAFSEVPTPTLAKGHVRVAIRAAGVNFVDALLISGGYQIKLPVPFIPGSEVAGVVTEVDTDAQGLCVGDRVVATPGIGGFAQEVVANPATVFPLPSSMEFVEGATFVQANTTACYALMQRAMLRAGETLLVLGAAGGTGSAAVRVGKMLGANVIAAASSHEKLAHCKRSGADALVCYAQEDLKAQVKELTDGRGADVVFDPVGGELSEPALRATAENGRFLVVGFASGSIPKIPLNLPLLKSCQIVGVDWGAYYRKRPEEGTRSVRKVLELAGREELRPIETQAYKLEDAGKALRDIMERKVVGKAVLVV